MKKSQLIAKLQEMPADLPIMFKVAQELTGSDAHSWMRGECAGVKVEDLYLLDDEFLVDRERMFDEVYDEPQKFGLSESPSDEEIEDWLDKRKETVIAVLVQP